MHARRARRAHITRRFARADPSPRTERRPKRRRESRTMTGDLTREKPRRRRAHAARERPCSTAAVMNHPRCTHAACVARASPVARRSARAAPSLRTERRPKRRRETRTTTGDRTREKNQGPRRKSTTARDVPARLRRREPPTKASTSVTSRCLLGLVLGVTD